MNVKKATNSQLSTTESKKTNQANNQNRNRIISIEITWEAYQLGGGRQSVGERCRD